DHRGHAGGGAADHDGANVVVVDAVLAQGQAHGEIRGGARNVGGQSAAFELFRRADVRFADDVVGQGVDQAVDDKNIPAGELAVDCRSADCAGEGEIAGDQTLNAAGAAVDEDQLHVEAVLFEQPRLLGDPVRRRGAGRIRDVREADLLGPRGRAGS